MNGDYVVSPPDVLLVVNDVNSAGSLDGTAGAEGEAALLAQAAVGKPSVPDASRLGNGDSLGFLGAALVEILDAGLPAPSQPLTAGLATSPIRRSTEPDEAQGSDVADVRYDVLAQPDTTPRLAERDGYFLSQSEESTIQDSGLLDLLAGDISDVWG